MLKEVKDPALILNLPKEKETSKIGTMVIIVLQCIPRGGTTSFKIVSSFSSSTTNCIGERFYVFSET